jgi:hypothetical protein
MNPVDPRLLDDVAVDVVSEQPPPTTPRQVRPAPPVPAHQHPFVRRVLATFPGAVIIDDRTPKDQ